MLDLFLHQRKKSIYAGTKGCRYSKNITAPSKWGTEMEHYLKMAKLLQDFTSVLLIFESLHWFCHFDAFFFLEYRQLSSLFKSILSWVVFIESLCSINKPAVCP